MLGNVSRHGRVLLVVNQPYTIGSLPLTVARNMGIAVAYLPGTGHAQDRAAAAGGREDRPQGRACDRVGRAAQAARDAQGRGPGWLETLAALKLLAGHDEDLAHESTRHVNRLRSLLLQTHPAFERALKGERIARDATLALLNDTAGPWA